MKYTTLGNSGIEVSALCVGGMSFGEPDPARHTWTIGPDETRAVLERALDAGITFIDTANVYAHGTSEAYIGRALRDLGVPRDKVVLASKVFFNPGGSSPAAITREIEGTLTRLDTDYLDLYILHRFDYNTPIEDTLEALNRLVEAGKVRALGASAMYAYQFHTMAQAQATRGWAGFSSMQCHYNLLYREDEREMLPLCRQLGVLPTPYSPLASGHLARATWDSSSERSRTDSTMRAKYDSTREADMTIVARVAEVAKHRGVPMARIALAWQFAHGPASPIVGFSSPTRVDEAVAALDIELDAEEVAYLEEPYVPHPIVGALARPGEAPTAGSGTPVLGR